MLKIARWVFKIKQNREGFGSFRTVGQLFKQAMVSFIRLMTGAGKPFDWSQLIANWSQQIHMHDRSLNRVFLVASYVESLWLVQFTSDRAALFINDNRTLAFEKKNFLKIRVDKRRFAEDENGGGELVELDGFTTHLNQFF